MNNNKINYQWIDSDTTEGNKVRQEESKKYNFRTVPMVFKGDQFIGGCNEFFAKL